MRLSKVGVVRRAVLSAVVVTALAGVAACGSAGSSHDAAGKDTGSHGKGRSDSGGVFKVTPMTALRTAERSTSKADSARVESTMALGTQMTAKSEGVLGWGHGITGTMTLTYTGGTLAEAARQAGADSIEARYLPDAYYANLGEKAAQKTGGKHWIKYAYDDLEDLAGSSGAYLKDQIENTTPNDSVRLLLASGDVKKVGTEKVRGEDTTHYAGTVRVTDLAARNSSLTESQLADLKKQLQQSGITTETVDIWINADDLLVKQTEEGRTSSGLMSMTAYYTDYGVKVSAEEPPASDTADFKDLMHAQSAS